MSSFLHGRDSMGVGLGAGVGGLAGADGNVLPGITLGFAGMGIGMVGVVMGELLACMRDRDLPCRE